MMEHMSRDAQKNLFYLFTFIARLLNISSIRACLILSVTRERQ